MPTISESYEHQSPLNPPLQSGLETLSQTQEVEFTLYVKLILPLDGYVFWVRADLVNDAVVSTCCKYNVPISNAYGGGDLVETLPKYCFKAKGSLHYSTQTQQEEDEVMSLNSVIFSSQEEISDMNKVGPSLMYLGEFEKIRFAFNQRSSFYKQANIYHYQGNALYPALASQVVDDLKDFDNQNVVVSNSLPIWLSLNQFMPMYPSFLVQDNLEPPYASVHVIPESTEAIGAMPLWDNQSQHSQLVQEKVRITLYGMRNFNALDFQDYVLQYSLDNPDIIGFNNIPVMRDEKRTQSELSVIAQKKVFEMEINYYQIRARDLARQLILHCVPAFGIQPLASVNPNSVFYLRSM